VNVNAAKAEELLECEFFHFEHQNRNKKIIRSGTLYSLPEEIAEHVDIVGGVLHFPKLKPKVNTKDLKRDTKWDLQVTPNDLRDQYQIGSASGKAKNNSQSVVQFLEEFYSQVDLDEFFLLFSRSTLGNSPTVIGYDGWGAGLEASLDIQYIMSIGANVPTTFWSVADPTNPNEDYFLDWMLQVDQDPKAPIVSSISYGEDEKDLTSEYANRISVEFMKQGLRGISVLFASGDSGVGGDDRSCKRFVPDFPAGCPYVTSVGGTTLDGWFETGEEVVNDLSGGGFSDFFGQPSYQVKNVQNYFQVAKGHLPPASKWNSTGRGYPDVSGLSANYIIVADLIPFPGVAGTSCSTPVFSGVIALLNDIRLSNGKKQLGFLNPVLYQMQQKYPQTFTDITKGSNPGCSSNGFQAAVGWDPASGLGSPVYSEMAKVILNF